MLNANYQRPNNVFQSITVKLGSASDFDAFQQAVTHNPHLQVQALREREYFANQSRTVTTLITVLGGLVALVMGLGAILAALNTMYSSSRNARARSPSCAPSASARAASFSRSCPSRS